MPGATPKPDERTRYSSRRADQVEIQAWAEFDEEGRRLWESVGDVLQPEAGETLWDAGDLYDLYLVLAGGICLVDRRGGRVRFVVEAGDFVGELGMLMDSRPSSPALRWRTRRSCACASRT